MPVKTLRIVGIVLCAIVAMCAAFVFHGRAFESILPYLFIAINALIAQEFGTWAGVVSTIATTLVFAEFLFEPLHSIHVSNIDQRSSLGWMFILGLALSEILGRQSHNHTSGGDRPQI